MENGGLTRDVWVSIGNLSHVRDVISLTHVCRRLRKFLFSTITCERLVPCSMWTVRSVIAGWRGKFFFARADNLLRTICLSRWREAHGGPYCVMQDWARQEFGLRFQGWQFEPVACDLIRCQKKLKLE